VLDSSAAWNTYKGKLKLFAMHYCRAPCVGLARNVV